MDPEALPFASPDLLQRKASEIAFLLCVARAEIRRKLEIPLRQQPASAKSLSKTPNIQSQGDLHLYTIKLPINRHRAAAIRIRGGS